MNTRLLGAAVLIALAVIFLPMVFSGKSPPAEGGDTVSLAIPNAPEQALKTKTMNLAPDAVIHGSNPASGQSSTTPASSDRLPTVNIGSNRPRDVETDPQAGKPAAPTTVTIGSGASPSQPVIPAQGKSTAASVKTTPASVKPAAAPVRPVAKATAKAPAKTSQSEAIGHGAYTLNLSAYASAAGAARLQRRVRALGYPVKGYPLTHAGKKRTLVIAGPFETRTAAEAARLKITQSIPGVPARLAQDAAPASRASVVAPAGANHTKAGGWAVQLAAMSTEADAIALRDKLRADGFDAFVDSVQSGGKRLWRVRAGPQTRRADAQRVHDAIKAKLGIDGNVVSVP
ncbi:MAG: SPOR domain-containing protein [Rhodanobacter sp.]|nr:MAG: SPOR domain-containing protein [Rhodanobacter sp.]